MPRAKFIKANKRERISRMDFEAAHQVIVKSVVVKDRTGACPRPATTAELIRAQQR